MKQLVLFLIFSSVCCLQVLADNITGTICDETNTPISDVNVSICTLKDRKIVLSTQTTAKGVFILRDVEAGKYTLLCSHSSYIDYKAEVQISKESNLDLGILVMRVRNVQLEEVTIIADRNVFTTDKQRIYPSEQQVETSVSGLDLLKKLPIPLLLINPINRTISSLDPSGGVALFINDIPADANDIAIINPKQIKRVEIIRNPGLKYGANIAIVINLVLNQARNGVSLGLNTSNSAKITNGYNNLYATYNNKNSQFSVNQSENYQNYSRLHSEDSRQYLLPNDVWHTMHTQSLSARTLSATHSTTLKYNLTQPDKYVFQIQGYVNFHRNPKQNNTFLVSESGEKDYTYYTHSKDQYNSPALNLYFKKYLPHQQELVINAVGTYIRSDYNYSYQQEDGDFETSYGIDGKKTSFIGEVKYSKGFKWLNMTSGLRSFYSDTKNNYSGSINQENKMRNSNSNAYLQMDGRWKQLSGSVSLSLDYQYYTQDKDKYHKLSFTPQINFNYSLSPVISLGYQFNLASRLPSLALLNDITIQKDKWERRVGNPYLKPFNHVENSLRATYYKKNWYGMLNVTFASNKNAIMPTVTRTEVDGHTFYDEGVRNQRYMNQLALMAYLRYATFNNKLIISGSGTYNLFHAKSDLYTNKRGFFYGNLSLESYLGKFYLSAGVNSRYNSLFAETVWYNEYSSFLSATYSWKNLKVGLTWEQPFQHGGTNNRVETFNNVVYKVVKNRNIEAGNNIMFTISWNWNHGIKSKTQEAELDNKDADAGILK